jgi:hypothetical protein
MEAVIDFQAFSAPLQVHFLMLPKAISFTTSSIVTILLYAENFSSSVNHLLLEENKRQIGNSIPLLLMICINKTVEND